MYILFCAGMTRLKPPLPGHRLPCVKAGAADIMCSPGSQVNLPTDLHLSQAGKCTFMVPFPDRETPNTLLGLLRKTNICDRTISVIGPVFFFLKNRLDIKKVDSFPFFFFKNTTSSRPFSVQTFCCRRSVRVRVFEF